VDDLFLWDQALYTERLIPARLREMMFRPNLSNYGYGWGILVPAKGAPYAGETIPMHGGAIFWFQSMIQRILRHKELIVLLDNSDSDKLPVIANEIRALLAVNR
jgi:CubicO group peptidase (beta-lactamase class C family)